MQTRNIKLGLVLLVVAICPSLPLSVRRIQTNMPLHMLFQLSALLIAGYYLSRHFAIKWIEVSTFLIQVSRWLWSYFTLLFWMLPINVDRVLQYGYWDMLKILSLVLAGFLQTNNVIKLFFMGFFYQETDLRLCSGYLLDAQQTTGYGLMLFGFSTLFFLITQFERSK